MRVEKTERTHRSIMHHLFLCLRCDIKTVINLQRPGEHASCGNPLEQESGFTYLPEAFMEAGSKFAPAAAVPG